MKVNGIIHQFLRFPTSPISHALNDFTFQIKLQLLSNKLLFNRSSVTNIYNKTKHSEVTDNCDWHGSFANVFINDVKSKETIDIQIQKLEQQTSFFQIT